MGIPIDRIATTTSFYSFPIPFGACTTKSSSSKVTWLKVSWSQRLLNICKNSKTNLSQGWLRKFFLWDEGYDFKINQHKVWSILTMLYEVLVEAMSGMIDFESEAKMAWKMSWSWHSLKGWAEASKIGRNNIESSSYPKRL